MSLYAVFLNTGALSLHQAPGASGTMSQAAAQCWYAIPTSPQARHDWAGNTSCSSHLLPTGLWQLPVLPSSSSTPAAAAAYSDLSATFGDWPLLPSDDSSASSNVSISNERGMYDGAGSTAAGTDTVMNVLLLLGGDSACNGSSSKAFAEDSSSSFDSAGQTQLPHPAASPQRPRSRYGCPPNAPMRRPPPVMLLPAEELPGLVLD
jgi:hypothetical protein